MQPGSKLPIESADPDFPVPIFSGEPGSGGDGADLLAGFKALNNLCLSDNVNSIILNFYQGTEPNVLTYERSDYSDTGCINKVVELRVSMRIVLMGEGPLPLTTAMDMDYFSLELKLASDSSVDQYKACNYDTAKIGEYYPLIDISTCDKIEGGKSYSIFRYDAGVLYIGSPRIDSFGDSPATRHNHLESLLQVYTSVN